jgi:hypothetical protein
MSGLFYRARVDAVSITSTPTTSDILELLNGATNPVTVHRIVMNCKSVTTSEFYNVQLLKRTSAGTGGGAGTVVPKADINTRAAAVTTNAGRTTTVGTASTIYGGWDWNLIIPFDEVHGKMAMEIEIPARPGGVSLSISSLRGQEYSTGTLSLRNANGFFNHVLQFVAARYRASRGPFRSSCDQSHATHVLVCA